MGASHCQVMHSNHVLELFYLQKVSRHTLGLATTRSDSFEDGGKIGISNSGSGTCAPF